MASRVVPVLRELDGAALADDEGGDAELLGEQLQAAVGVVRLEGVEQAGGAAGEGGAGVEVGHEVGQVVDVEDAVLVVVPRDQADHPGGVELAQVGQEDRVGLAGRDVHDGDVVGQRAVQAYDARVGDREQVAQHPDHRGDAGAGGDEEELAALGGQHELAGGLLEVDQGARRACRGRGGC